VYFGKVTQNSLTVLKIVGIGGLLAAGFVAAGWMEDRGQPEVYHGEVKGFVLDYVVLSQRDQTEIPLKINGATKLIVDGQERKDWHTEAEKVLEEIKGKEARAVAAPDSPGVAESIKVNTRSMLAIIGMGLIFVLWTYSGWHEGAYVVSEVREERRTIPLALLLGTGSVLLIYVAVNLACLAGLGFERAGESQTIAADVLALVLGENGGRAMALLVMLSCLGAVNGTIFTSSRIFAEMGRDHALFSKLADWNERRGTPLNALVVQGVVSMGMVVFVSIAFGGDAPFEDLVNCTAAAFWVFFLLTVVSLFVLRSKDRDLPRPFRVPFFPVVPLVFCLACVWMIYSSIDYRPWHSLVGLGLLALGVPLFLISQALKRGKGVAEPGPKDAGEERRGQEGP
jgi:amino acid transporter